MEKEILVGEPYGEIISGPTRAEYDALVESHFRLAKTVEGIQQMLGKAAEYQGKPRGRLPR